MVDALIKENVDGFSNQPGKFVSRAVSHTLSLATSIARDPADGTTATLPERVGWGGDGSPDGTLRSFIDGAIKQHYPQRLDRVVGTDFRLPTNAERDQILAFQLALGRTQDINLTAVTLTDAGAAAGKTAFMDPLVGRCNECHSNAGANALASGKNRNFNTGTVTAPATATVAIGTFPDGSFLFDGGFGGQGQTNPNFDALPPTGADSFGDGTFSTPPLIEAADTGPFFHQHGFGQGNGDPTASIESGVAFYATQPVPRRRRPPRSSTGASGARRSTWVRRSGPSGASCACSTPRSTSRWPSSAWTQRTCSTSSSGATATTSRRASCAWPRRRSMTRAACS